MTVGLMIDKQTRDSQWQRADCTLGWDLAREGGKKPLTFIGVLVFNSVWKI